MLNNINSNTFIRLGKWILTVCFVVFLVMTAAADFRKTKVKRLNYIMPRSYKYLVDVAENQKGLNKARLKKYAYYYKMVIQQMPHRPDAYGMLGFCYYHLGKQKKAISFYEKAIELNPYFLGFYNDLGTIYFKNGDYRKALTFFEKAIKTKPQSALKFIYSSSKICLPIIAERLARSGSSFIEELRSTYRQSYELMILSYYHLKDYPKMFNASLYAMQSFSEDKDIFFYYQQLAAYELVGRKKSSAVPLRNNLARSRMRNIYLRIF